MILHAIIYAIPHTFTLVPATSLATCLFIVKYGVWETT